MALVEVRKLTKIYAAGGMLARGSGFRAVDDVSLDIHAGETLGLVGESGSGKTTLGRLILRLIEPTSGTVIFDGRDVLSGSRGELRQLRRQMQIIFQDPFGSLDPRMRVEEIVTEPLRIHGLNGSPGRLPYVDVSPSTPHAGQERRRSRYRSTAAQLMKAVGLEESALRRYPHEFSGGQRQRIGIARALALRPKFIVADEPVSALDVSVGAQIVNLLKDLQRDFGLTYLFISHSMPVVRYLSTRIAVMNRGKIVEIGSTEEITERPQQEYTKKLLAATPELEVAR
ncbi:MAG TPA: ATP-binding cassette domain-containing protein [Terriglobales bacterium]|nr:ATP-binding cassette domain-containing protein [Terriglobales bacterium]